MAVLELGAWGTGGWMVLCRVKGMSVMGKRKRKVYMLSVGGKVPNWLKLELLIPPQM